MAVVFARLRSRANTPNPVVGWPACEGMGVRSKLHSERLAEIRRHHRHIPGRSPAGLRDVRQGWILSTPEICLRIWCERNQPHTSIFSKTLYQDDNPFFIRDHQYCILCGRCVRVCDEIVGVHAIDFVGAGFESYIATPYDGPMINSTCVFCGNCVQVCPTAALMPDLAVETRSRMGVGASQIDLRLLRRWLPD